MREIAARSMDATGAECRGAAEQQAPSGLLPAPIDSLCRRAARTVQVGGGSGGYADFVYRYAARELHGVHIGEHDALDWKRGRNSDMQEIELLVRVKPNTRDSESPLISPTRSPIGVQRTRHQAH